MDKNNLLLKKHISLSLWRSHYKSLKPLPIKVFSKALTKKTKHVKLKQWVYPPLHRGQLRTYILIKRLNKDEATCLS